MNLTALYQVRGNISKYVKKYELFIKVGLKFLAFFALFRIISGADIFTQTGVFNSFWVHLVLALVATLLPSRTGVLIAMALVVYNIFQTSLIGAVIVGVMMMILYVAIARMFPDQIYFLVLIPICIQWNLYLLVPLFAGLYVGVIAVVPIVGGILLWGLGQIVPAFMSLQMGESLDALPKMISDASTYGIEQITKNDQMVYLLIISAGIVLLVSLLKKLRLDYVRYIALGAGGALGIVCLIMGKIAVELSGNMIVLILLAIVSIGGIALLEFLNLSLNYKTAQNLEFEDEEYYYQVRVIPKINPVAKPKKEVKTITEDTEEEMAKTRISGWRVQEEPKPVRKPKAEAPHRVPNKESVHPSVKPLRKESGEDKQSAGENRPIRQTTGESAAKEPVRKRPSKPIKKSTNSKEEEVADLFAEWDDKR